MNIKTETETGKEKGRQITMVQRTLVVKGAKLLRAKKGVKFVTIAEKFPCTITIIGNGRTCDGKSLISLMNAVMSFGDEMEIICDGEQEREALEALCEFVSREMVENE